MITFYKTNLPFSPTPNSVLKKTFSSVLLFPRVYRALLNWKKQYIARYLLVQTCPHSASLSIEALGTSLARAVLSVVTTMRRCFCHLVIARATSLKSENKQLKWICSVQDEVFLLLKIGSKLMQRLFQSIYISKTFFIAQPWQAAGLVILFKVRSPDFWLKRLGRSVSTKYWVYIR